MEFGQWFLPHQRSTWCDTAHCHHITMPHYNGTLLHTLDLISIPPLIAYIRWISYRLPASFFEALDVKAWGTVPFHAKLRRIFGQVGGLHVSRLGTVIPLVTSRHHAHITYHPSEVISTTLVFTVYHTLLLTATGSTHTVFARRRVATESVLQRRHR
jgi:hypothetical protein